MSVLTDLIASQVKTSAASSNLGDSVLKGLTDSVVGSITEKAQSTSGIDQLTSLFTGKTAAGSSPVTALATQLFTSKIASKLGLDEKTAKTASALLPTIISSLVSSVSKGKDGVNLQSMISSVGGAVTQETVKNLAADGLKKAAGGLLGKFFKK